MIDSSHWLKDRNICKRQMASDVVSRTCLLWSLHLLRMYLYVCEGAPSCTTFKSSVSELESRNMNTERTITAAQHGGYHRPLFASSIFIHRNGRYDGKLLTSFMQWLLGIARGPRPLPSPHQPKTPVSFCTAINEAGSTLITYCVMIFRTQDRKAFR
jgi:hypothetical protein